MGFIYNNESFGELLTIRVFSMLTLTVRFIKSTMWRGSLDHSFGSFLMPLGLSMDTAYRPMIHSTADFPRST